MPGQWDDPLPPDPRKRNRPNQAPAESWNEASSSSAPAGIIGRYLQPARQNPRQPTLTGDAPPWAPATRAFCPLGEDENYPQSRIHKRARDSIISARRREKQSEDPHYDAGRMTVGGAGAHNSVSRTGGSDLVQSPKRAMDTFMHACSCHNGTAPPNTNEPEEHSGSGDRITSKDLAPLRESKLNSSGSLRVSEYISPITTDGSKRIVNRVSLQPIPSTGSELDRNVPGTSAQHSRLKKLQKITDTIMRKPKAARLATIEESPEEEISEIDHHIKKEQEMRQRLAISDRETRRAHNCPYFWETLNALSIHYLPKYDINWLWSHCIIIDPQFRALAAIREEGEMHESMKKVIDEYKQWASINQDGPINLEVRHVRDRGQSQQDYEARVDEFLAVLHLLDPEMLLEMSIYSRTFEVEEDDGRMPYYANRMPWSCTTCLGLGYYEHHRAGYREAGKPIVPPHKRDSYQTKPLKIPQSNLLSYHSADTDDEIGDLRAATASLFIYDAKGDIIHNDGNVPPRPPSLVDQFRFWMPDKDYRFTVTDIENLVKRAKRNARRHDREIHELHTSRVQALYSYQKHVFEEALKQEENERASSGNSIGEKSLLDKSDSKNRNFDLPSRVHFTFPDLWKDPKTYIPIGWSAIRQHLKDKWHPPGDPDVDPRVSAAKRKKDKRVKENLWGFYKCLAWWIFSSSVLWLILWAVMWRGQDLDRDDLGVHRNGGNTVGFCVATQYPPWFGDCRQVMLDEAKRQWREQQAQEGSDNKGTETGEGEGDNPADSADPGEISDPEIVEWKPEQDPVPGWVKTDIEGLY